MIKTRRTSDCRRDSDFSGSANACLRVYRMGENAVSHFGGSSHSVGLLGPGSDHGLALRYFSKH